MNIASANITVCAAGEDACLRIVGRATFQVSADFKKAVAELAQNGHRNFSLDLEQCLSMDSTFLGVLIGFRNGKLIPNHPIAFGLLKPPQRILDVLSNLGVAPLFHTVAGDGFGAGPFVPISGASAPEKSKLETSRLCLQAHETLMAANPANVPKFKEVAAMMKEDVKKLEEDSEAKP